MTGIYMEGYDCFCGQMGTPAKDTTKLPLSAMRTLCSWWLLTTAGDG